MKKRPKFQKNNFSNPYVWHYKDERVELVEMTLSQAVIRYPGGEPFIIGSKAISKWLR